MNELIAEFERQHMISHVEHALVLFPDGSSETFCSDSAYFVAIPKNINTEDAVLTHSHPAEAIQDENNTLSIGDMMAAINLNLKEVRAFNQYKTCILKRPENGWPKLTNDMLAVYTMSRIIPLTSEISAKFRDEHMPDAEYLEINHMEE